MVEPGGEVCAFDGQGPLAVDRADLEEPAKLGLPPSDDDNRRVLAVIAYLQA